MKKSKPNFPLGCKIRQLREIWLCKLVTPVSLILLTFIYFLLPCANAFSKDLEIRNLTDYEILNIQVKPEKNKEAFFIRLDLLPGAAGKIENPDTIGDLRVDTGLAMEIFPKINLKKTLRLSFCMEHSPCIIIEEDNGALEHVKGERISLLPAAGAKPVCELNRFRPRMPMREVCSLLEKDNLTDDNGAWLTSLGFCGLVWAARMVPTQNGQKLETAALEHMELRRPLSDNECSAIISTLFKQGYVPWQAEFPGLNIDFPQLPGKNVEERKTLLLDTLANFLAENPSNRRPPQINNISDEESEAQILFVPAASLHDLANAEEPQNDAQVITMLVKPLTSTLILDITAYEGTKK